LKFGGRGVSSDFEPNPRGALAFWTKSQGSTLFWVLLNLHGRVLCNTLSEPRPANGGQFYVYGVTYLSDVRYSERNILTIFNLQIISFKVIEKKRGNDSTFWVSTNIK
jgi:hypothetical protein